MLEGGHARHVGRLVVHIHICHLGCREATQTTYNQRGNNRGHDQQRQCQWQPLINCEDHPTMKNDTTGRTGCTSNVHPGDDQQAEHQHHLSHLPAPDRGAHRRHPTTVNAPKLGPNIVHILFSVSVEPVESSTPDSSTLFSTATSSVASIGTTRRHPPTV